MEYVGDAIKLVVFVAILAFVGVKMLLAKGLPAAWVSSSTPSWLSGVHIPTAWSLLVIAVILTGGIVGSVLWAPTIGITATTRTSTTRSAWAARRSASKATA